jgi:aminoglycoside phosphotransferase
VKRQPQPSAAADFRAAAVSALRSSADRCGLDPRGARLIRLFATAVYHLPAAGAVARITPVASADTVTRLATAVTLWRYMPQKGPRPVPADLGLLLRRLHQLDPPPFTLPAYRPLLSVREAIESSQAINEGERAWLRNRCAQLVDAYDGLSSLLPAGMVHGDAWQGNLLRDGHRVVLADWDEVSTGPREIDLVPTLQATRFGLPEPQRDAFIATYGHDIRTWDCYPVLHEIRELSTTSALLREGNANEVAQQQLQVRLRSLHTGNDQQWTPF